MESSTWVEFGNLAGHEALSYMNCVGELSKAKRGIKVFTTYTNNGFLYAIPTKNQVVTVLFKSDVVSPIFVSINHAIQYIKIKNRKKNNNDFKFDDSKSLWFRPHIESADYVSHHNYKKSLFIENGFTHFDKDSNTCSFSLVQRDFSYVLDLPLNFVI